MKKISAINVIEFRRKTPVSQITFINRLNAPKKEEASDGGNYWTTSISAIGNTFKLDNKDIIAAKINILLEKHNKATATIAKNMFRRNIEILHKFEDFDFSVLKPKFVLTYLSKPNEKSILIIKNVPVQVLPNYVFTY